MATSKKASKHSVKQSSLARILILVGTVLSGAAILILLLTFYPVILEELGYQFRSASRTVSGSAKPADLTPIDTSFGIVIPKLGANARVIPNVDPFDSRAYQAALARGVAHARGTSYPGTPGNVFLFSHSSVDFYRATQFNSVFYLLNKLEAGDEVHLYYQDQKYVYRVTDKKTVGADAVSYLSGRGMGLPAQAGKSLTLMTCWPPGTSLKRLVVLAEIVAQ